MKKKKNDFLAVLLLTLIVFISVVALTLTDGVTREKIEIAQKDAVAEMLASLFPTMEDFTYEQKADKYVALADGQEVGQAFMAEGSGYGGPISILVGIETDGSLRGIEIISHLETPGLGAKITDPAFLDQFKGTLRDELALSANGGSIDAITGATISSSAVVTAVKEATDRWEP